MKILSAFLYAFSTVCLYADKEYLLSVKTNILLIMSFLLNLLNIFLFQDQILFYVILGINIAMNAFLFRMDTILKSVIYSLFAIIELLFLHYTILVFCYYKNIVNFPYFVESILFIFFVYGMRSKIQNISVIDGYIFSGLFISLNMIAIFAAIRVLEGSKKTFSLLPSIVIYLVLLIFACCYCY